MVQPIKIVSGFRNSVKFSWETMTHWKNREISQKWQEYWWSFIIRNKDKVNINLFDNHEYMTFDLAMNNTEYFDNVESLFSANAPMKYILENPGFKWDWYIISYMNKYITEDDILGNLDLPWDWNIMSENPNITFKFIEKMKDKPWDWNMLSYWDKVIPERNISWAFVLKNLDLDWEWAHLTTRPDITWEYMQSTKHVLPWDYRTKIYNPNVPLDYVLKNYLPYIISDTKYINEIIADNKYDAYYSGNSLTHMNAYMFMTRNKHITLVNLNKLYTKHKALFQDPVYFSMFMCGFTTNPRITMNYVLNHPEIEWNWEFLCNNVNITLADVIQHPEINWCYKSLSNKESLTIEFVESNIDKPWDWEALAENEFTQSKQAFYLAEYKRHLMAFRIQQWWHKLREDPRHPVGIRRLEREYDALFGPGVL